MNYSHFLTKKISQLTLGTVQLGLQYGIANKDGKPTAENAQSLLQTALNLGINSFDTAASYGNCENLIGDSFNRKLGRAKDICIITKLKPISFIGISWFNFWLNILTLDTTCSLFSAPITMLVIPSKDRTKFIANS